jgi:hypothetical protein
MTNLCFATNGQAGLVRREELNGITYRVLPVVAIKEGVLNQEFVSAAEIAACLDQWNGRPVTVAHPQVGDTYVTANDPSIASAYVVGQVYYNSFAENKQRGEIWVDEARAQHSDAGRELLTRIDAGLPIEVSTAYFRDIDPTPGSWNGVAYNGRAYNLRPDHLAILLHERGACSWEDGCGCPRVNVEEGESEEKMQVNILSKARKPDYSGTTSAPWEGPAISDYIAAIPEAIRSESPRVEEMSAEAKAWIAGHSLLGDPAADNARDLLLFPVVTPGGELSEGALSAVISGRGAAAEIPDAAKASAQELARQLLNDEFERELETNAEAGFLERFWDELGRRLGLIKAPEAPPEEETEVAAQPEAPTETEEETMEENAMEDEKKAPQSVCNCVAESAAPPVVNALSPEMEAVVEAFGGEEAAIKALNDLLKSREESRAEMIDNLKANTAFTEDALKALSCEALQMLAHTVKPADYSALGGGPQVNREGGDLVSMSF